MSRTFHLPVIIDAHHNFHRDESGRVEAVERWNSDIARAQYNHPDVLSQIAPGLSLRWLQTASNALKILMIEQL